MDGVNGIGASHAYRLPMFPLSTVLFPLGRLSLHVFEPRYRQMTADCLAGNGELGIVLITRGREVGGGDERAPVGTVGHIEHAAHLPDGRWLLSVTGRRRVRAVEWLTEDPYPVAMVEDVDRSGHRAPTGHSGAEGPQGPRLEAAFAAVRRARALLSEAGGPGPISAELEAAVRAARATQDAAWRLCDAAPLGDLDRQRLLETGRLGDRLDLVRSLSDEIARDVERMLGN